MNKKWNLPKPEMLDETMEGGEKRCESLVKIASAIQLFHLKVFVVKLFTQLPWTWVNYNYGCVIDLFDLGIWK